MSRNFLMGFHQASLRHKGLAAKGEAKRLCRAIKCASGAPSRCSETLIRSQPIEKYSPNCLLARCQFERDLPGYTDPSRTSAKMLRYTATSHGFWCSSFSTLD